MSGLGRESLNDVKRFCEVFRPQELERNEEIPRGSGLDTGNGSTTRHTPLRHFCQCLDPLCCTADGLYPCVGLIHDRCQWCRNKCGSPCHTRKRAFRELIVTLFALVVESSVGVVKTEVVREP